MRPLILTSLAALALVHAPAPADACSIADDRAEPPAVEHAYDASRAPGAPTIVEARIQHDENDDVGCMMSSCGDIHGLSLRVDVAAGTELLRIDFANTTRPTLYAHVWNSGGGETYVFLPGFAEDDMLVMDVQALDADGYPSAAVEITAYSDDYDEGGCRAGASTHTSAALVLLASLLMVRRRYDARRA